MTEFDWNRIEPARVLVSMLDTKWAADDEWNLNARMTLIQVEIGFDPSDFDLDQSQGMSYQQTMLADLEALHGAFKTLLEGREVGYDETITFLALEFSLCPLHFVDYAICFDNEDEECAPIRAVHPCHDT